MHLRECWRDSSRFGRATSASWLVFFIPAISPAKTRWRAPPRAPAIALSKPHQGIGGPSLSIQGVSKNPDESANPHLGTGVGLLAAERDWNTGEDSKPEIGRPQLDAEV